MLSEHRDIAVMGYRPDLVTTDGHSSYPRAIRTVLGKTVRHRISAYFNNRLEQDHRGIKGRIRCMASRTTTRSIASVESTANSLRPRRCHNQVVPASLRRFHFARGA